MTYFSKISSLALGLGLIGGLSLSNLAAANTVSTASPNQTQLVVEGGSERLQQNRVA